jgi:hypothetical protein
MTDTVDEDLDTEATKQPTPPGATCGAKYLDADHPRYVPSCARFAGHDDTHRGYGFSIKNPLEWTDADALTWWLDAESTWRENVPIWLEAEATWWGREGSPWLEAEAAWWRDEVLPWLDAEAIWLDEQLETWLDAEAAWRREPKVVVWLAAEARWREQQDDEKRVG